MAQLNRDRYVRADEKTYGQSDGLFYDKTTGKYVIIKGNSVYVLSGQMLVGDGTDLIPVTPSGAFTIDSAGVSTLGSAVAANSVLAKPRLRIIREQLLASALTDGGAAVGTKVMSTLAIPAGAWVHKALVDTIVGFTGDTTAVLTLGDGTTANRYMTGSPSLFTTAAAGVDVGVVSGTAWHTAAKTVTATVTSTADVTPVLASGGSCFVTIAFYEPV